MGVRGWSASRPDRFTPSKDSVPFVMEAGWVPLSVWTGAENFSSTGTRSPFRPARSESLYRLSYPGKLLVYMLTRWEVAGYHGRLLPGWVLCLNHNFRELL